MLKKSHKLVPIRFLETIKVQKVLRKSQSTRMVSKVPGSQENSKDAGKVPRKKRVPVMKVPRETTKKLF